MKTAIITLLCAFACFFTTACSAPSKINANMTDTTLRAKLATVIQDGMTREQVDQGLDTLDVSKDWRMWYDAQDGRPPIQFVRIFPPGGFWPQNDGGFISWVDVSFVFSNGTNLSRTVLFRDGVRYTGAYPLNPPQRTPAGPIGAFPAPIPPPLNPLQFSE